MQKKDFIQTAAITFLPQTGWDLNKAISYAEQLWKRLNERGYGEIKANGPRELEKAYDKLNPLQKTGFDLFWLAFDYKEGKDKAALSWLKLGDIEKTELDEILKAAKQTALDRKQLPEGQVAIMAQGWLSQRRWLDKRPSQTEKTRQMISAKEHEIRQITGHLNHAKSMTEKTTDEFWIKEVIKLTEKLSQLRTLS